MKTISKKGQINQLSPAILALVFAAIVLVFGLVISQNLRDTTVTGGLGCNDTDTSLCGEAFFAANETIAGLGTFANFWEIIVLAIVITIVIGLLLMVFGSSKGR